MKQLTYCPVCNSGAIQFQYEGRTNRRPDDPATWRVFKCETCSHGFMNPQPSWEELAAYYVEDYDPYVKNHGSDAEDDAKTVAIAKQTGEFRHLPLPAGKRVLDVGCGAGWFLRIAKQLGAETFGIEPSAFGARNSRAAGIDVFNGTVEDYLQSQGNDRRFDVITANHVIEHAPDPVKTLQGMRSLLAPGGLLWMSVPNAASHFSRTLGGEWHSADLPYHLQQFSLKSLSFAGDQAGLKTRRQYTYSLPAATAASLRFLLRRRYLVPQRLTMKIGLLNDGYASAVAARHDKNLEGEAIIGEFVANSPQ